MLKYKLFATIFLVFIVSDKVIATCNLDNALEFISMIHSTSWKYKNKSKFETIEGPGLQKKYIADYEAIRTDEKFCASYYCINSVSVVSNNIKKTLFFIHWGGTSFPDTNEQSIVFTNNKNRVACLVQHTGGDIFRDEALRIIKNNLKPYAINKPEYEKKRIP